MCDYSLQSVKSRPAKIGEKLRTQHFNTGTIGFAAPEDTKTAVCVLPGTELAFATAIRCDPLGWFGWKMRVVNHTTAIFRQVNKNNPLTHHDALEFPNGRMVLLTHLLEGRKRRCFSFRRNLLQRRKSKPKNGFDTSVDLQTVSLGRLHAGAAFLSGLSSIQIPNPSRRRRQT
jgi:hypothetical protein